MLVRRRRRDHLLVPAAEAAALLRRLLRDGRGRVAAAAAVASGIAAAATDADGSQPDTGVSAATDCVGPPVLPHHCRVGVGGCKCDGGHRQ